MIATRSRRSAARSSAALPPRCAAVGARQKRPRSAHSGATQARPNAGCEHPVMLVMHVIVGTRIEARCASITGITGTYAEPGGRVISDHRHNAAFRRSASPDRSVAYLPGDELGVDPPSIYQDNRSGCP